jgi:hypothetical protein
MLAYTDIRPSHHGVSTCMYELDIHAYTAAVKAIYYIINDGMRKLVNVPIDLN